MSKDNQDQTTRDFVPDESKSSNKDATLGEEKGKSMKNPDEKQKVSSKAKVAKAATEQENFVPKVTRIPKSVVIDSAPVEKPAENPLSSQKIEMGEKQESSVKEKNEKSLADKVVVIEKKAASETRKVDKPAPLEQEDADLSQKPLVTKDVLIKDKGLQQQPSQDTSKIQRPPATGGYQGQRPPATGERTGGYQGQRPPATGERTGGYQGQRPPATGERTGGYQGQRPPATGGYQGQRPPATGGYQGQRPPATGAKRPAFGGGFVDKDKDSGDEQRRPQTKRPAGARPSDKGAAPQPVIEKPSTTYRQEKKVFVKDMIVERANKQEMLRSKDLSGKDGYSKSKRYGSKSFKGRKEAKKEMPPVTPKKVVIGETVLVGELAKSMGKTGAEIIKKLLEMGTMVTINQELDADTAVLLAGEFGVTVEIRADKTAEIMEDIEDDSRMMQERPPVVTVMGHVDHGKTSLLDAIRKANVTATEAGGITQHIGAYQVEINNKKITFLDTPGHEAFTAMRARGAQITDISIIVVAADDGVMPQTIEAINHSKAAKVPVIIAINKVDKPSANTDRVKQELMEYGYVPEEWGGDTIMVPVSAKTHAGLEQLLEMILLVAEVGELRANSKRQARGTVVEAQLDKNRGPVATLLVQKGTLRLGDSILAGAVFGKVRAMNDYKGRNVKSAGPSMPVEVLGFSDVPAAGEIFIAVKDDKDARLVASQQQIKKREEELRKSSKVSLDDLYKQIAQGEIKELNLVLKADVQGSIEALRQSLVKLNTEEVKVNVIHAGVGGITESDIMLASASNAIIIGFNVRPDANSRKAAEQEKVDIRLYRVIYDAIEDIKNAMSGLLAPEIKEVVVGHAEVRAVFKVPKAGMIAGCYITDGKIHRQNLIRIIRDNIVITESKIDSLRRFKDDAKEVLSGFECGIGVENFNDIKEGDVIEAYMMEEIKREL